ncbi:hypothetical protein LDENG_00237560 [Lucifuga dentata]|nr:hypothetical protein LDENG_00237560 [Lucifuga dentata]
MPHHVQSGKSEAKLATTNKNDHDYSQMDITTTSPCGVKRKPAPVTPTKSPAPPSKVISSQDPAETPTVALMEAIQTLTAKMDSFGDQLRENSIMVANITRREKGRHCQIIMQFTMRHHRDAIWKLSKNSKICKDLKIHFKQDFCKADREARAAAWPKMERARAAGKTVYYRGHVGYINGNRVMLD